MKTLQRRLFMAVLLAAPLGWGLTLGLTFWRAHHEINELYDTDMVRVAQYVQAVTGKLPVERAAEVNAQAGAESAPAPSLGDAGLDYVTVAAWPPKGEPINLDDRAVALPRADGTEGFVDLPLQGHDWRVFYLDQADTGWRIAVGQRQDERRELTVAYVLGQLLPSLLGLPILLVLLVVAVRQALRPVRQLSADIEKRQPLDPTPIANEHVPAEITPVVAAMNGLLKRAADAAEHERRFIADAAHELRTPLAALKAQWEAARLLGDAAERRQHERLVQKGIDRLQRLVEQLLALSRLERRGAHTFDDSIDWHAVSSQAISDCWALARDKGMDIECIWPLRGDLPLPVSGNTELLTALLRNLVDNAVRYSPSGSLIKVAFARDRIEVMDEGGGVEGEQLRRLGDRFYRRAGSQQDGSGLGLSIVARIAELHGLDIRFANRRDGEGHVRGLSVSIVRQTVAGQQSAAPGFAQPR